MIPTSGWGFRWAIHPELTSSILAGTLCRFSARVAKLADALDSESSGRKVVQVQILSRAPLVTVLKPPQNFGAATRNSQKVRSALRETSAYKIRLNVPNITEVNL